MRLGVKHQNQQTIVRADFSGGLNTSANVDGIAENQLSIAINVEVDHATGKLRSVAGTTDILCFEKIFAALYDGINKKILLVTKDKGVYAVDVTTNKVSEELGQLSGDLYPNSTSWENGLLIASGGNLQYFNGSTLETIKNSPNATSVYVRAGRVLVAETNTVRYSGVGDETNWEEDTNDDSSSKFVEAGYKDGGELIGLINLSSDLLLIKNNRRVYRLYGEYPYWQIIEVSRNVDVSGRQSYCSVADSVFILGRSEVQNIQTTNFYGDMKLQDAAQLISREIQNLPPNVFLRYVSPLNQIWAISGRDVLMLDLVTNSWYKRVFNTAVIDVLTVGNEVFVIKGDRISKLDANSFSDSGEPIEWRWQGRRLTSQYDYFLKRTQISFIPLDTANYSGQLRVGRVIVPFPMFGRKATSAKNSWRRFFLSDGGIVYDNDEQIYENSKPIYSKPTILTESRNVYRSKFLDIGCRGYGGIIFNTINLELTEV